MKRTIILLGMLFFLSGCDTSNWRFSGSTEMPLSYKTPMAVKDYEILDTVHGEYSRICLLFSLFCFGEVYPYDALMQQAIQKGGNSVINFVTDTDTSSPFWYPLYMRKTVRVNGLAIKLTKTKQNVRYSYGEN